MFYQKYFIIYTCTCIYLERNPMKLQTNYLSHFDHICNNFCLIYLTTNDSVTNRYLLLTVKLLVGGKYSIN